MAWNDGPIAHEERVRLRDGFYDFWKHELSSRRPRSSEACSRSSILELLEDGFRKRVLCPARRMARMAAAAQPAPLNCHGVKTNMSLAGK